MDRRALLLSGSAGLTGLAGCDVSDLARDPRRITMAVARDITSLDPAATFVISNQLAINLAYQKLVTAELGPDGPTGRIVGDLAQAWETSADGLQWTLHRQPLEPLAELAGLMAGRGAVLAGELGRSRNSGAAGDTLPGGTGILGLVHPVQLELGDPPLADPLPLYAPLRHGGFGGPHLASRLELRFLRGALQALNSRNALSRRCCRALFSPQRLPEIVGNDLLVLQSLLSGHALEVSLPPHPSPA